MPILVGKHNMNNSLLHFCILNQLPKILDMLKSVLIYRIIVLCLSLTKHTSDQENKKNMYFYLKTYFLSFNNHCV